MIIETNDWLSVAQFAQKVGRKSSWMTHFVHNGTLRVIRMGRYWFIHKDCLETWPPATKKLGRPIKPEMSTGGYMGEDC